MPLCLERAMPVLGAASRLSCMLFSSRRYFRRQRARHAGADIGFSAASPASEKLYIFFHRRDISFWPHRSHRADTENIFVRHAIIDFGPMISLLLEWFTSFLPLSSNFDRHGELPRPYRLGHASAASPIRLLLPFITDYLIT